MPAGLVLVVMTSQGLMKADCLICSNLQVEYIDMYIIHWPFKLGKEVRTMPVERDLVQPLDIKSVWEAMEECKKLGLARGIGVSNFTSSMLEELLSFAEIPPAVNQVRLFT